jgi:hypothetical protein
VSAPRPVGPATRVRLPAPSPNPCFEGFDSLAPYGMMPDLDSLPGRLAGRVATRGKVGRDAAPDRG